MNEPVTIGRTTYPHRFFRAATSEKKATKEGHLTEELFKVYEDLAKEGAGTILTGYTFVSEEEQPTANMMGIKDDSYIEEYRTLTEMVHSYGGKILLQIVYGGSQSQGDPEKREVPGPSDFVHPRSGIRACKMEEEDFRRIKGAFVEGALRAEKAGFDGVEVHGAHGYLLSQFLTPAYNSRKDEYGGSVENRVRFLREICEEIRRATGKDFALWVKINSSDGFPRGLTEEDALKAGKILGEIVDVIEVSGGNLFQVPKTPEEESYFKDFAMALSRETRGAVALTGGNRSLEVMEEIKKKSKVALFGFSRPLLEDPGYIGKLLEKSSEFAEGERKPERRP